jgi:hypothetical protein
MRASVRMVPSEYDAYLGAVATAAAALVGLLFVAVSVRNDTIFGRNAVPGGEALAISAFGGLVNAFVVALLGLIPKTNIGETAVIMAVLSVLSTIRLQRRRPALTRDARCSLPHSVRLPPHPAGQSVLPRDAMSVYVLQAEILRPTFFMR